jgi:hypothetical protein
MGGVNPYGDEQQLIKLTAEYHVPPCALFFSWVKKTEEYAKIQTRGIEPRLRATFPSPPMQGGSMCSIHYCSISFNSNQL